MNHSSTAFTHAFTRRPSQSIVNGLREIDSGPPNFEKFLAAHDTYVQALRDTGAKVIVADALEDYPDSVFVEDPALCVMGVAIILRPGAGSRFGERDAARRDLAPIFGTDNVIDLPEGGIVDGGDILVAGREVLIGLSARTDLAGVDALRVLLGDVGLNLRILDMPSDILHFKTGCGLLDDETIFAIEGLGDSFEGYNVITCPQGEEPAANLIRFNDKVFVSAAYKKTQDLLTAKGFDVVAIDNTQAEKVDGGLSCMSLRFSLP